MEVQQKAARALGAPAKVVAKGSESGISNQDRLRAGSLLLIGGGLIALGLLALVFSSHRYVPAIALAVVAIGLVSVIWTPGIEIPSGNARIRPLLFTLFAVVAAGSSHFAWGRAKRV